MNTETLIELFGGAGVVVVWALVVILMVVSMWKVFAKAGKPGWASIIPIYNTIVMLQIARKPLWWVLLFFIPVANLVAALLMTHGIAKAFGRSGGFTIGLFLLPIIFYPILAFGDSQHHSDLPMVPPPVNPPAPTSTATI